MTKASVLCSVGGSMDAPSAASCLWILLLVSPAAGKTLRRDFAGRRVFALPRHNAVLPCPSASRDHASRFSAAEWSRLDGPTHVTVHAERAGHELEKEKATEYVGRTRVMADGSLKLLDVTQRDSATYRCVLVRAAATDEATVALVVGEVPAISLTLRRTPANHVQLYWESSGWFQEPRASLLDGDRTELGAQATVSVSADHLYSIWVELDPAAVQTNMTIICRVEMPGTILVVENRIHITDDFAPREAGGSDLVLWGLVASVVLVLVLVLGLLLVVFLVPTEKLEKLRSWLQRRIGYRHVSITDTPRTSSGAVDQLSVTEYGDITQVTTSGYSGHIMIDGQRLTGVAASHELAKKDLAGLERYKPEVIRIGNKLGVHPAVIAAIISRQSKFGAALRVDGYGQRDGNSFGLMQINRHYHAIKGSPLSEEHLDQGTTFLIQLIKTMKREKKNWTKEQQLKGALACYISGEEKVLPLAYEALDSVTPGGDFASDVVARAQWFAHNAF